MKNQSKKQKISEAENECQSYDMKSAFFMDKDGDLSVKVRWLWDSFEQNLKIDTPTHKPVIERMHSNGDCDMIDSS